MKKIIPALAALYCAPIFLGYVYFGGGSELNSIKLISLEARLKIKGCLLRTPYCGRNTHPIKRVPTTSMCFFVVPRLFTVPR
jgi:hypothetical protein